MSTEFINELFSNGINFHSIYYHDNKWKIIEFIQYKDNPHNSDPNQYLSYRRRLYLLYEASKAINGELILVIYNNNNYKHNIKCGIVTKVDFTDHSRNYITLNDIPHMKQNITYDEFKGYFNNINGNAWIPPGLKINRYNLNYESKTIDKADSYVKGFIKELLGNNKTSGIDCDSVYYCGGKWKIIEFLKCEHDNITPHGSHPRNYPWNWKKFYMLYKLAEALKGELILVNYSYRYPCKGKVSKMQVTGFDYDTIETYINTDYKARPSKLDYMTIKKEDITFDKFKQIFRDMNYNSGLPPKI